MADNDQDIKIGIGIDADTSGAEAAEEALAKVNKEAAKSDGVGDDGSAASQRRTVRAEEETLAKRAIQTKEEEAQATKELTGAEEDLFKGLEDRLAAMRETVDARKNAAAGGGGEAEQVGKILDIQRAQIANDIAQGIGAISDKLREMGASAGGADTELGRTLNTASIGFDSLSASVSLAGQGFAVGGPLGAGIGATIGLISGPLKAALDDMTKQLELARQAELNAAAANKRLQEARAEFAAQVRNENLTAFFNAETQAIDKQIAAINRRDQVAAALRSAETAERESGQAGAARADTKGTNKAGLAAADIAGDFADAQAAISAEVAKAEAVAAKLEEKAVTLALKAGAIAAQEGSGDAKAVEAQKSADQAQQAADSAKADAEAAAEIAAAKVRELLANFNTKFDTAADVVGQDAAAAAEAVLEKINIRWR